MKKHKEIINAWREVLKTNPGNAEAHINIGISLQNLRKYKEAEKEYREAIRVDPKNTKAHASLGLLLTRSSENERFSEGLSELQIAFNNRKDLQDNGKLVIGRIEEIHKFYWNKTRDKAQDKGLSFATVLSDLYLNIKDYDNALKWLNNVWNLKEFLNDEERAMVLLRLGHVYGFMKEYEKAEQKISEARKLFEKSENRKMIKVCDEVLEEIDTLIK